VGINIQFKGSC